MVKLGTDAQVGLEGGVLGSRMLEFGLISMGSVVENFGGIGDGLLFRKWRSWRVISGWFGS